MKKLVISTIFGLFAISCFNNVSRETLHSDILYVKNILHENNLYKITFENKNGFVYNYISEDGDFCNNEIYSAILSNNKTQKIYDDKIVELKYQGEK